MNTISDYAWPEAFWPGFIEKYWEQQPGSFTCPAKRPFISLEELFEVVTHMPSRVLSGRFWIAKNKPPKSIRDFTTGAFKLFGPQKSDGDFMGYFKRLSQHSTGINIHNLDKAMPDLWPRVQGFIDTLSQVAGHPPSQNWDLDTFFGTYHVTPFGIHKDPASVFAFVLMGKRTYYTWYTWPSDYFKRGDEALQMPDLDKIKPHLDKAETFTLNAGEIFYWPSNRWHVVLSDGKPSVVAQVSTYFKHKDLGHWDAGTPGY